MADTDEMAVLLQEAISEMKESRKQTKALLEQNKLLAEQNNSLAEQVKEVVAESSRKKSTKSQIKVSVHIKV